MAYTVNEQSMARYTATLKDETEAVIPASALTALTLTLRDKATNTVINSRNAQDVLNANNVTISTGGALTWSVQAADNVVKDTLLNTEIHTALFHATWSTGSKEMYHSFEIAVNNMPNVSTS